MQIVSKHFQHYKALIMLGVPIIVGQLGVIILGLADTLMIGHHSTEELGAASLVNTIFSLILIFSMGFSYGLTPLVGDLFGRREYGKVGQILKNSLVANSVLGVIVMTIMGVLYFNLDKLGQPEELIPVMRPYYLVNYISLPFVLWFNSFKQFGDGITDTRTPMWILLGGNMMNIIGNYILIYGKFGLPEMGLFGAGLSTMISRILMFTVFFIIFFNRKSYKIYSEGFKDGKINKKDFIVLNKMGWPLAMQQGLEVAAFSLSGIMVGWLGTEALAAHQITLTIAQLCFMSYYGMGAAVAVRVSYFKGQNDRQQVLQTARLGMNINLVMAVFTCIPMIIFRNYIGALFTDNAAVSLYVAEAIIPLLAYQFGDAMQCNYLNALRGISIVKPLMNISFIAYFMISLPISYVLGIYLNLGLVGVWTAFPISLSVAGILYYWIFRKNVVKTSNL